MAKRVMKNMTFSIDGVELASHCQAVAVEDTAEEVDVTGLGGNNGYREIEPGLKDATITVTLFQDFDPGSVHATLQPLYESGAEVTVELTPSDGPVSATNPKASMTGKLFNYSGINGSVGEAMTIEVPIRNTGNGITWSTT